MQFFKDEERNGILVKAFWKEGKNPTLVPLVANSVDAAQEKHVPVVEIDGATITVKVGSVEHPMTEAHYIQFIALETARGFAVRRLSPADKPEAQFVLADGDVAEAVYEYCNLHGLWVTDLQ